MRSFQELSSLRYKLQLRLRRHRSDPMFASRQDSEALLTRLGQRIEFLDSILEDFPVYQWIMGEDIPEDNLVEHNYVRPRD